MVVVLEGGTAGNFLVNGLVYDYFVGYYGHAISSSAHYPGTQVADGEPLGSVYRDQLHYRPDGRTLDESRRRALR